MIQPVSSGNFRLGSEEIAPILLPLDLVYRLPQQLSSMRIIGQIIQARLFEVPNHFPTQ